MSAARRGGRARRPAGSPEPPRATYRLQLRAHGVDLAAAGRLVPYLARLGVSHLYLSPFLRARTGSDHGYDVVDPRVVDPALGGERALGRLAKTARDHGLRLLADIVPNHAAAHPENPFFADVLSRGQASLHASWFDVDWEAGRSRIVLPVLPARRKACIASGHIRVAREGGAPVLRVGDLTLPLAPETHADARALAAHRDGARGDPAALARLLRRQHYELVYWRRSGTRLNYRRFFDIDDLIAVRAAEPEVFARSHGTLAAFLRTGWLDGVRVDHVDGIADPERYLRQLRRIAPRPRLVVVEKILAPDEVLPARWPADGTTGYEFLNRSEALFLDAAGCARIERGWARRAGARGSFQAAARAAKARAIRGVLRPALRRSTRALMTCQPRGARLDERAAREALVAFASHLDVYRVYPRREGLSADERRRVQGALAGAARDGAPRAGLAALRRLLLAPRSTPQQLAAARRIQQLCVSAAAKGVEDTAFYDHAPLLSRTEVGGEPGRPLDGAVADFHAAMGRRVRRPRGLLAASTHDTKRSADVRARLDVLSERPAEWLAAVDRWREQNAPLRRRAGGPDPRTELFFYQTLVGAWPLGGLAPLRAAARRELAELTDRVDAAMLKSAREAERHTGWVDPDERFERTLRAFVRGALLPPGGRSPFLADLDRFATGLSRPGLWNALARRLLQLTAPGIPDLYQADESWRFDLVDPDNRRPVDFPALGRELRALTRFDDASPARQLELLSEWMRHPENGRLPLHVVRRALAARKRTPDLFLNGAYQPVRAEGETAAHVLAFTRRLGRHVALVVVPRLPLTLTRAPDVPPTGPIWGDTRLLLPPWLARRRLRHALTGHPARPPYLRDLLTPLPLALLT